MNDTPASGERVEKYVFNFEIYCFAKKRPIYPILPYSYRVRPLFRPYPTENYRPARYYNMLIFQVFIALSASPYTIPVLRFHESLDDECQ